MYYIHIIQIAQKLKKSQFVRIYLFDSKIAKKKINLIYVETKLT